MVGFERRHDAFSRCQQTNAFSIGQLCARRGAPCAGSGDHTKARTNAAAIAIVSGPCHEQAARETQTGERHDARAQKRHRRRELEVARREPLQRDMCCKGALRLADEIRAQTCKLLFYYF